jgi:tetratricopeptide (TPR) repeat protein
LSSCDTAWDYAQSTSDTELKSAVLSNRGILLTRMRRLKEAIESQELALRIDSERGSPSAVAYSRNNLAAALFHAGRAREAIAHIEEAVKIRRGLNEPDELVASYACRATS